MPIRKRKPDSQAPAAIGPKTVPTDSLQPNPHNPRYLFDEDPLTTLRESINKVGILVPLTVFKAAGSNKYTILDGQRRWICAQRLELPSVPINEVAEPSTVQNIVTMFQIHKLRKDWELMPTALKLGVLIDELQEKRDRHLADLTGLDVAVVTRCKKLLWYPKKYQSMMLFKEPKDRIKADFFIELYPVLTDRLVKSADWYNRNHLIDRFLHKYENKLSGFRSITDFRKIKQYLTAARAAGREELILTRMKRFIDDDTKDISSLEIDAARIKRHADRLTRNISRILEELGEVDVQDYLGEEELWDELERLLVQTRKMLAAADRRPK